MKHVVFILGSYYPNFSAVGYCGHKIIQELKKNHKITVISQKQDIDQATYESYENHVIRRVSTPTIDRELKIKNNKQFLAKKISQIYRFTRKILSKKTIDHSLVNSYKSDLNSLSLQVDAIITLVSPIETLCAAVDYKTTFNDIIIIPIFFDKFAGSESLHGLSINKKLKFKSNLHYEKFLLERASQVLSMPSLKAYFDQYYLEVESKKIIYVEHPLLLEQKKILNKKRDNNNKDIVFVYAGSFIRNIRTPEYFLKLVKSMTKDLPLSFKLYTFGKYNELIEKNQQFGVIKLIANGQVDKTIADAAVQEADFLINIGDIKGLQISSKIFEYMALGKAIIHLASVEDDIDSRILRKYPLSLCLLQDIALLEENIVKIYKFIRLYRGVKIPFADVANIFPEALPDTTAKLLSKLIE